MTNDTRSPKEIEREIEEQRSDLTANLEDLQDKFSIDTVVRQIGDQFREHGGDMGRSISEQIKANPIPLALTGIGLAWMMFANAPKPTSRSVSYEDDGYSRAEHDFRRARMDQGHPYTPPTRVTPGYADAPSWAQDDDADGRSITDQLADGVEAAKNKASQAASAVKSAASSVTSAASDGASRTGFAVADAGNAVGASVARGAQSARDGIATAGNRIAEGTEAMSQDARQRVIAARWKAVQLRNSAARSLNDGADVAADFYDRQPLVIGALAIAVGAALGGALPRTKVEDDVMGARSDRLFDEAERIFEEEKAKALAVAQSVKDEVKDIASETKADLDSGAPGDTSATDAVNAQAKSAAKRLADKTKESARDQNLGKPKV